MHDTTSPFVPAPSQQQATGVPMYYYGNNLQPQAQPQPQQHHKKSKKSKKSKRPTVHLPFSYGARCATYSIVMVLALLGFAFGLVAACSETYMPIYVTHKYFYTFYMGNRTISTTDAIRLQAFSAHADLSEEPCRKSASSVVEAGKMLRAATYSGSICVPAPGAVVASGGMGIVVVILSFVLLVVTCVVLGLLSCHRKRAAKLAAEEAKEVELQQVQQTMTQATTGGGVVYVISNETTAVLAPPATAAATPHIMSPEEAAQQERLDAQEAQVRRILGIVCLVAAVIALLFSVVGLATAMAPESDLKKQMDVVRNMDNITAVWSTGAVNSTTCWSHICNIVLLGIAVVLLAVPFLSGITDRPAAVGKRQEEREEEAVMVGGHIADEEIQTSAASYTK